MNNSIKEKLILNFILPVQLVHNDASYTSACFILIHRNKTGSASAHSRQAPVHSTLEQDPAFSGNFEIKIVWLLGKLQKYNLAVTE